MFPAFSETLDLHSICEALQNEPNQNTLKDISKKNLDVKLTSALKDPEQVRDAVCIIGGLKNSKMLPQVLEIPSASLTPELFSTISIIQTPEQKNLVNKKMKEWIKDPSSESKTLKTVGALQLLSNNGEAIDFSQITELMRTDNHEIKIQTFDYFTKMRASYSSQQEKDIFTLAIHQSPFQLRVAAIEYFQSLPKANQASLKPELKSCKSDSAPEVREICP